MARRFYQLPSLTCLNTFDACARHGSFTAAASELGVTLGAVSRQIKLLETELKCLLFNRLHRGVELTGEGLELFQVLSQSFQQIGKLCRTLKSRSKAGDVTIAATTAFASLWLMPRLGNFWQCYEDINLNHSISDNPLDPGFVGADIRIRYGDGSWRSEAVYKLLDDFIYPVCSPEFFARYAIGSPEDLLNMPLLRLDSVDPGWTGWDAWLAEWDCDPTEANFRRFNNYVVSLQAAEESQGVALGWHSMVEPLVRTGRLVRMGAWQMKAPGAYYLTWDENKPLSEAAEQLRSWLVEIASKDTTV
ncbi:MAG: LysR substrate-binding domain-containing protein [Gammaproteobacteria bacterium]|nr:LysR substrate-binding domain-containing protein [Gammaproteobacteria bacterium]